MSWCLKWVSDLAYDAQCGKKQWGGCTTIFCYCFFMACSCWFSWLSLNPSEPSILLQHQLDDDREWMARWVPWQPWCWVPTLQSQTCWFSGVIWYMCSHLWWVLTWIAAPNSRAEATFFSLWCQLFHFNKMNQAIGVAFRIMGCFFHQSLDLQCRTHALFHDSQRTKANYNSDFTENDTLLCGFPWEATWNL